MVVFAMGSVRVRKGTGKLFMDFRFQGERCREQTLLEDTPANQKKLKQLLQRIEAEITLGNFNYAQYFPNSGQVLKFTQRSALTTGEPDTPLFSEFAITWFNEMRIQWRSSQCDTVKNVLDKHLLPAFGTRKVGDISKADILAFRSSLALLSGHGGQSLSPSRINHIMTPLRLILNEAADRFDFTTPYRGIKSLNIPRTRVQPFTLDEVWLILAGVRDDFKNYYVTRFFTGMRTSEIHGLRWKNVDFESRQILVCEAWVNNKVEVTKNDGSNREIYMSQIVFDALREQFKITGKMDYVFCNRTGMPLHNANITNRVWYPLLRHLNLEKRRPYQTRHTAATLWLASGESPEWIARQMGHSTTEMLFRVYSRYVPNLTRNDGSAFERLLAESQKMENQNER
jgi:integrase